jgi:hypothetical protein
MRACLCAAIFLAALAGRAPAGDPALVHVVQVRVPGAERAARLAHACGLCPDGVQAQYDAARTLEEAVRGMRVGAGCQALLRATLTYARGLVEEAEGVDRPLAEVRRDGARRARLGLRRLDALGRSCTPGRAQPHRPPVELRSPRSGAAFFGLVEDEPAEGATDAVLYANGVIAGRVHSRPGRIRFVVRRPPGRYDLVVRQRRSGRVIRTATARGAWLLPSAGNRARPVRGTDERLAAGLAVRGQSFRGWAGLWVHDLATGRTAGWNADARFPAASTVKIGVLLAALHRSDPADRYDLETLTRWSSNLAANRLLARVGGPAVVQSLLSRLGARNSTYPGAYRVGTAVVADAPRPPPPVSWRYTTARDLGRLLWVVQAAAVGNRSAQRLAGLDRQRARLALGLLLASEPTGNNVGLLRPALGGVPLAQKNGWTTSTRHTAAIAFLREGPRIVVVLTYRPDLALRDARALGRAVVLLVR